MADPEFDAHWQQLAQAALASLSDWRRGHPQATLTEIEDALDERLHPLRAQLLEDAAQAAPAARLSQMPAEQRPRCPHCQSPLVARGKQKRLLQTEGGQQVRLTREYGVCPECGAGVFPPR